MGEWYMDYEDCPRCDGTGGPDPIWDEDTGRSVTYVCGWCSGSGARRVIRELRDGQIM